MRGLQRSFICFLPFSEEIQHLIDFLFCGSLVNENVTHIAQQGEIDDACCILLVVGHVAVQFLIIIAGDGQGAVVLLDETDGLTHLVGGEVSLDAREVKFADQSPSYSIAMQIGLAAECPTLEGMTCRVPEVECLADAMFQRVFLHNAFLSLMATLVPTI